MNGVDLPGELEHLAQRLHACRATAGVAGLVPDVPEENAWVRTVFQKEFLAHPVELRLQLGIVHLGVPHLARETAMLALLASAMVADVARLRPRLRELPDLLRAHAVVAENDNRAHLVLVENLERQLKARHEAVVVRKPDAEPLKLHENAHRIEPDLLADSKFAVHLLEMLLSAERLPLVRAVRAARGHVVAAADPGLFVVPFPSLFPRPGPRTFGPHAARRAQHGNRKQKLLHEMNPSRW